MEVVMTTEAIRHAKLQSNCHHQQTNTQCFTGQISFLSPNQRCQSTEGKNFNSGYMDAKFSAALASSAAPCSSGCCGGWTWNWELHSKIKTSSPFSNYVKYMVGMKNSWFFSQTYGCIYETQDNVIHIYCGTLIAMSSNALADNLWWPTLSHISKKSTACNSLFPQCFDTVGWEKQAVCMATQYAPAPLHPRWAPKHLACRRADAT